VFRKRDDQAVVYEMEADPVAIGISDESTEGEKRRRIVVVATEDGRLWKVPVKKQDKKRGRAEADAGAGRAPKRPTVDPPNAGEICFSANDVESAATLKPQWCLGMVPGVRQLCQSAAGEEATMLASLVTGEVVRLSWAGGPLEVFPLANPGEVICAVPASAREICHKVIGDSGSEAIAMCGSVAAGELSFLTVSKARETVGCLGEACVSVAMVRSQNGDVCGVVGIGACGAVLLSLPSQHVYRVPCNVKMAAVVGEDLIFVTEEGMLMAAKLTCIHKAQPVASARLEVRCLGVSGVAALAPAGMSAVLVTAEGELLELLPQWSDGESVQAGLAGTLDPCAVEARVKQLVSQLGGLSSSQQRLAAEDETQGAALAKANAVLHRAAKLPTTCRIVPQYHPLRSDAPAVLSIEVADKELTPEWSLVVTMARGAHGSETGGGASVASSSVCIPVDSMAPTSRGTLRGECSVPKECLPPHSAEIGAGTIEVRVMLCCALRGGAESLATCFMAGASLDIFDFVAAQVSRKREASLVALTHFKLALEIASRPGSASPSLGSLLGLAGRVPDKALADPMRVKLLVHPATELELTLREVGRREGASLAEKEGDQGKEEAVCFELGVQLPGDDAVVATRMYTAITARLREAEGVTIHGDGAGVRKRGEAMRPSMTECKAVLERAEGGGGNTAGSAEAELAVSKALRVTRVMVAEHCQNQRD